MHCQMISQTHNDMTLGKVLRRSLKRRANSVGCMASPADAYDTQVGAVIVGNSLACLKAALHLSISRMHPVLIEEEGQLERMSTEDLRVRDDCYQAGCAFTRVEAFSELEFVISTTTSSSSAVGVKLSSTWTSGSALRAARTYYSNLIFISSSVAPPHNVCSSWSLLRGPELTVMSGNSGAWLMTEHLIFKMLQHTALLSAHKANASCVAPWLQAPTAAPSRSTSPSPSPTSCRETRTPSSTSSISTKASWRQAFFAKPVSPAHSEHTSVSLH
jgi:hypothetical protein